MGKVRYRNRKRDEKEIIEVQKPVSINTRSMTMILISIRGVDSTCVFEEHLAVCCSNSGTGFNDILQNFEQSFVRQEHQ